MDAMTTAIQTSAPALAMTRLGVLYFAYLQLQAMSDPAEHPEWFDVLSDDPRWHGKDPERYIKRIELTFPHVDLNLEAHAAYDWLQSPKGLKKKVLRGFWINWLKNVRKDDPALKGL